MSVNKYLSFAFFICLVLRVNCNAGDSPLDRRLEIGSIQNMTTERLAAKILSAAGIPGGIVELRSCVTDSQKEPAAKQSFDARGMTVRQALDLITVNDPGYKWVFDGRTVNVVPVTEMPAVMNTRLSQFETSEDYTNIDFERKLLGASQIKAFFSAQGYTEEDRLVSRVGPGSVRLKHALSLKDATVLEILNAAAQAYQVPAVWHYTERTGTCQKTFYLDWPVL